MLVYFCATAIDGVNLDLLGIALGHASESLTQVFAFTNYFPF